MVLCAFVFSKLKKKLTSFKPYQCILKQSRIKNLTLVGFQKLSIWDCKFYRFCGFEHFPVDCHCFLCVLVTLVGVGRYFLVRAGESEYESLGIINTNPVAKTSVDSGLSEKGKKQTLRAAFELKAMGACEKGCWIWASITQRAYQAAEIIASINGVSRRCVTFDSNQINCSGRKKEERYFLLI